MLVDIHTHRSADYLNLVKSGQAEPLSSPPGEFFHLYLNIHPQDLIPEINLPPWISLSSGIHPWQAQAMLEPEKLRTVLAVDLISMIGEIGLDKKCGVDIETQLKVFEFQLEIASDLKKPVLIHDVGCMAEILSCKRRFPQIPAWIVHGFRGKKAQAQQWINKGVYLSFGPNHQEEALLACPADRLLLETDVSGVSIEQIYNKAAKTRGWSFAALENQVEKNVYGLFKQ